MTERLTWLSLVLFAAAARIYDVGSRAYHHDEGQIGFYAWTLLEQGGYRYDPLLHGPFIYYSTAFAELIGGTGDAVPRMVPVVMGTLLVALPYALREVIGRTPALIAGGLFAFGPTALYYARFAREDMTVAALTLGILVVALRPPTRATLPLLAGLLALSFTTKESTYLTVAMLAPPAVLWLRRTRFPADQWFLAAAVFASLYVTLFSSLYSNLGGIWDGIYGGPKYWSEQHGVNRGGEPWYFYAVLLAAIEPLLLVLGIAGAVHGIRTRDRRLMFLAYFAGASFAAYSIAGERFAWLAVHPIVPLTILAGVGALKVWRPVVVVLALYAVAATWSANARGPTDPRELLVTTQSAPDVAAVARYLRGLPGGLTIEVDATDGGGHPWAWYLKERPGVSYPRMTDDRFSPSGAALIASVAAPEPEGYLACRFRFRVFWGRDYGPLSPASFARYVAKREPWSPTGELMQTLYLRDGSRCPPGTRLGLRP